MVTGRVDSAEVEEVVRRLAAGLDELGKRAEPLPQRGVRNYLSLLRYHAAEGRQRDVLPLQNEGTDALLLQRRIELAFGKDLVRPDADLLEGVTLLLAGK